MLFRQYSGWNDHLDDYTLTSIPARRFYCYGDDRKKKYYTPKEFEELQTIGLDMGFKHVESGPLVRSSYHAERAIC